MSRLTKVWATAAPHRFAYMDTGVLDPKRLADLRKSLGLTQRGLAAKAGISQALIAELESGKHQGRTASIEKIASALGVPPSDLSPT